MTEPLFLLGLEGVVTMQDQADPGVGILSDPGLTEDQLTEPWKVSWAGKTGCLGDWAKTSDACWNLRAKMYKLLLSPFTTWREFSGDWPKLWPMCISNIPGRDCDVSFVLHHFEVLCMVWIWQEDDQKDITVGRRIMIMPLGTIFLFTKMWLGVQILSWYKPNAGIS